MVKMPSSCCVNNCKNQNCAGDSVAFFEFPSEKTLKKKWVEAIRNHLKEKNWEPRVDSRVCSVHFVSGQFSNHEWHPDYVPSVFRSLRTVLSKPKSRFLEGEDEEKKTKTPVPMKKLQGTLKRSNLSTPTRSTPKDRTISQKTSRGRPPKIVSVHAGVSPNIENSQDSLTSQGSKSVKRKYVSDSDDSGTVQLKNLSVVLERTSMKKMKLSNNDITVKEEPSSELEEYYEYPLPNSFGKSPGSCKKCLTLQQKLRNVQMQNKNQGEKCRRCPVLEHKLKKAEEEIDTLLEAKLNKCQKCSSLEMKTKRLENNVRKVQSDVGRLQTKLSSYEITEEAFKKYKGKVKMYTGLPNYETLMAIFDHIKNKFPAVSNNAMTSFQMFALVLMRIKLNFPFWDLTYRFGTSPNIIQSFYLQYVSIIESNLSHVVLWPEANRKYRLKILVNNLKQSFNILPDQIEVDTLLMGENQEMTEEQKVIRICAAIYHISQLVTSNHSQQLLRVLNNKNDIDKIQKEDKSKNAEEETMPKKSKLDTTDTSHATLVNGNEDIDDSDIFLEDLTKDITAVGVNSKDSLELECKNLRKDLDTLTHKLSNQFRFYTGMRNYDVYNNLLSFLSTFAGHIIQEKLRHFQQLHLVLIRFKLNLQVQDLSYLFGVEPDHVVYLTRQWIEVMSQRLSRYIDWPAGIEDADGEKKLLGTVKLKYQILWGPQLDQRNKKTGRDKEKINVRKLLHACAALYNIDDIEVFKDGKKESKAAEVEEKVTDKEKSTDDLEKDCRELRTLLYDLRRCSMTSIASCFTEETFMKNNEMVTFYTGFPNYDNLWNVFNAIVPSYKNESRKMLTPFQQFIITLLRLKLNIATQDVGFRFGTGQSNTHKLIQDWILILHSQVGPYISWPDDADDMQTFTNILRKTYAHLNVSFPSRNKDPKFNTEADIFDIPTQVCAGLFNMGDVSHIDQSDTEFDSFDEDW